MRARDLRVTSINVAENWLFGEAVRPGTNISNLVRTYNSNGPFTAISASCCRISPLGNPGGNYGVATTVRPGPGNRSPVSNLIPIIKVPAGGVRTWTIPASDANGDPLRFRLTATSEFQGNGSQPFGLAVNSTTGDVTWNTTGLTPGRLYWNNIAIEELDGAGVVKGKVMIDYLIEITNQVVTNNPPTFVAPTPACGSSIPASTGSLVTFTVRGSDPDAGNTVSMGVSGLPPGATSPMPAAGNPVQSVFNWTPGPSQTGPFPVSYSITDNNGAQALCNITVNVALSNRPPVINSFPPVTGNEGAAVTLSVDATDPDAGQTLSYAWNFGDGQTATTTSPTVSHVYVNNKPNNAPYPVMVTVTDNLGASANAGSTATINNVSPTVNAGPDQTVAAGQPVTLNISFTDPGDENTGVPPGWEFAVAWSATGPTQPSGQGGVLPGTPFQASFTYNTPGTYTVTVKVRELSETGGGTDQVIITVKDASPPVVTAAVTGTLGNNNWYTSNVGISFTVTDPDSPITSAVGCNAVTLSTDTQGQTYTCTAISDGGSASASVTVKRDATQPSITPNASGTPGENGWYTTPVTLMWAVSDATSGVDTQTDCSQDVVNADGSETFTCSATDKAGNSNSHTITIKKDGSPPLIAATVSGTQGQGGWYTGNVSVSWSVSDPTSGVAAKPGCDVSSVTTDTDANGITFTCTAKNGAGLSDARSVTVKRDASPPEVSGAATGPQQNGWFTGTVNVSWNVADPHSGIASSNGCAPTSHSTDTPGTTLNCSATNGAGLSAGSAVSFKRDATAPTFSFAGSLSYTVDQVVSVTCSAADALSGVATTNCTSPLASGPAYNFNLGSNSVTANATDVAGNSGSASRTFTVTVTHASLCALVRQFVTHNGVANSLCVKLQNSEAAKDRGNNNAARNMLEAFINEVRSEAGGKIPSASAPVLIRLAEALMP